VVLGLLLFHWLPHAVRDWKRLGERPHDLQTLAAIDRKRCFDPTLSGAS
jgi:hypothetical protein